MNMLNILIDNYLPEARPHIQRDILPVIRKFVSNYPRDSLKDLTLEEYMIAKEGYGNPSSFCRRIRYELDCMATMGNVYYKIFGVYLNHGTEVTVSNELIPYCGDDPEVAFKYIKEAMTNLLDAAERDDYKAIEECKLNKSFKYRLLMVYFPDKFVPVCTLGTLNGYCDAISMPYDPKEEPIYRNVALVNWKKSVPQMSDWNNEELMGFLDQMWRNHVKIDYRDYIGQ